VGNLVFGGIIGLGVDAATGAMNKYPATFQVPMVTIPASLQPPTIPQATPTPTTKPGGQ
jgi:hypothetical protein